MQARVTWDKGLAFVGETGSGHRLAIDGARQAGASPMELMLLGLGGCSSVDVVMILGRMRQPVTGCVCAIDAERAAEDPKVFTRIHLHYRVAGAGLDPAKVARAIALSAQKYCSASIMLGKTAALSHDFELAAPS
ncbi:MAG: OsmC family protein [Alphaproteobacteria bacterium]|nr:MAG: OsmC family protein [Alphaproteobacteria bacterium]